LTAFIRAFIIRVTSGKMRDFEYTRRILAMANVVGKRYRCAKCGSEFIVTKGGAGTLVCCGQPMELKK
jgi:desulfoferrodoxin-like iron-binding protein